MFKRRIGGKWGVPLFASSWESGLRQELQAVLQDKLLPAPGQACERVAVDLEALNPKVPGPSILPSHPTGDCNMAPCCVGLMTIYYPERNHIRVLRQNP